MNKVRDNISVGKQGRSSKVLLVIDETGNLSHHRRMLRAQGHKVYACHSYEQGLGLLGRDTFDLVAVSQGGLAFEGKGVVMRALEADRRTPVLVLAHAPDMNNYLEAMQLGAVDYLEMPVPPAELARVLKTHLRYCPAA
ncbi:MAG TPA: response regulator [Terriglobia bacterium]|nr:response regulator [Terriglobia bacterium]